jgi:hypothetical protein
MLVCKDVVIDNTNKGLSIFIPRRWLKRRAACQITPILRAQADAENSY